VRCTSGKEEVGMPELQATSADDILELLEIAQTLARAETALLTSDTTRAIVELQELQRRAIALAGKLEKHARSDAKAA
jgi:hypothetical protein